jgi:hypothetical protein
MGPETAAAPTRNYFMGKGQLPQKGQYSIIGGKIEERLNSAAVFYVESFLIW